MVLRRLDELNAYHNSTDAHHDSHDAEHAGNSHGSALARMAAQQDRGGRLKPGDRQRSRIVKTSMEKVQRRIAHRRVYMEKLSANPDLVRGDLLSDMLTPESDVPGSTALGELRYVQNKYLSEGNHVRVKLGRRKELKAKFKNAARAAAFGFIAAGGGKLKKVLKDEDPWEPPPPPKETVEVYEAEEEISSRERALQFWKRTQRMSNQSTESPAVRKLLAARALDEATATKNMQKTKRICRGTSRNTRKMQLQ